MRLLTFQQFVTRLMVVQGDFEYVTLAVYGDVASEPTLDSSSHGPMLLPDIIYQPLSPAMDPANSNEPTLLPRELLNLIPRAPSLSAAIRLIFCLKPVDGELNGDLISWEDCATTEVSGLEWLERAAEPLMTSVNEDVPLEILKKFSERIPEVLVEKVRSHHSQFLFHSCIYSDK